MPVRTPGVMLLEPFEESIDGVDPVFASAIATSCVFEREGKGVEDLEGFCFVLMLEAQGDGGELERFVDGVGFKSPPEVSSV